MIRLIIRDPIIGEIEYIGEPSFTLDTDSNLVSLYIGESDIPVLRLSVRSGEEIAEHIQRGLDTFHIQTN